MTDTSHTEMLAEFQALRGEILQLYNRRSQHLAVSWTALSLIFGAAGITQTPELGLLSVLIACSAWLDDMHNLRGIFRAGAYIEYFIEWRSEVIRWETANRISGIGEINLDRGQRIQRIVGSAYGVTTIITSVSTLLFFFRWPPTSAVRWVWSICFVGAICLPFVTLTAYRAWKMADVRDELRSQFKEARDRILSSTGASA